MTITAPTTTLEHIALGKIAKHPDNPRHDVGDVADLAASITEHGVLEPLVVVPWDSLPEDLAAGHRRKSVEYCLIAGHRRLAAAIEAKAKTVPVIVRHDLTTREQQIAAMVIENQHRADLSPVEEGEAYQLLLDITPKPTQAKVAKTVGMPKRRISERLRLTKLADTAKTAVHDGQITLTDALKLLELERHPDLAERAALAAGTKDFAVELQLAQRRMEALDRFDLVRDHAAKLGTQILESAPGYGMDSPRKVGQGTHGIPEVTAEANAKDPLLATGTAHAGCPGAAVYIPKAASGIYELGFYCTQYHEQHVVSAEDRAEEQAAAEEQRLAQMSDEERAELDRKHAEEQAAKAEQAERRIALEAAQATRRAHFTDVIQQAEPALAKWTAIDSATSTDGDYARGDFAGSLSKELLGVGDDAGAEDVRAAMEKLTLEQLAIHAWLLEHEYDDDGLVLHPWQQHADPYPEYVAALTDRFGYQWSTVEIDEFGLDEHGHVRPEIEDAA
ncbi:ParB/RepB/Spo0J family partition protein [Janibacter sp. GS2]|uniref:ParB/RepB/Spo0J family partition protein n=1 Tax=Janibacter sp. GS2 TaxID=3442646 RepID=UPI003EBC71A3